MAVVRWCQHSFALKDNYVIADFGVELIFVTGVTCFCLLVIFRMQRMKKSSKISKIERKLAPRVSPKVPPRLAKI